MVSQTQTSDNQGNTGHSNPATPPLVPTLVVIWAAGEEHLLGSSLIPSPVGPGVFGRGQPETTGNQVPLGLLWQYPRSRAAPPLANPKISRVQLLLRTAGGGLTVENVGRCPMTINNAEVRQGSLVPGDVVALGSQLAFLYLHRPTWLPWGSGPPPEQGFQGQQDPLGFVGESAAIWELRSSLLFVAERTGHVLIRGSSGSGKELVARALHASSSRRARPMISRNAATIPEGLVDAELFGNMKNYPNPGMAERPGLIGQAHGGTLFLDEFAELPPALQAHLLRVLDAGEYQRLGEAAPRASDFRLLAATNRPHDAIKHDVLARFLHEIVVPDLNERREDIPILVRHLLRSIAQSDPAAVSRFLPAGAGEPRVSRELILALVQRGYSTHVRELLALLWESIRRSPGPALDAWPGLVNAETSRASAPAPTPALSPALSPAPSPSGPSPAQIQACLDENNGSVDRTWRALGLSSRHVLKRLIAKYHLQVRRSFGDDSLDE